MLQDGFKVIAHIADSMVWHTLLKAPPMARMTFINGSRTGTMIDQSLDICRSSMLKNLLILQPVDLGMVVITLDISLMFRLLFIGLVKGLRCLKIARRVLM